MIRVVTTHGKNKDAEFKTYDEAKQYCFANSVVGFIFSSNDLPIAMCIRSQFFTINQVENSCTSLQCVYNHYVVNERYIL